MAIVKRPTPLPSPLDFVPASGVPHKVTRGESWWTLAESPEAQAADMSANDLCYYNFKTRKGAEINWYLYHKVGCRHTTKSGKNYIFTGNDNPGVVYLPKIGKPLPAEEIPPKLRVQSNVWVGVGIKAGTQNTSTGNESMLGAAVSSDDVLNEGPIRVMGIMANMQRDSGLGFGVSGGPCILVVTGVKDPRQLNGHRQVEWDFNVAVGLKLSGILRAGKLGPLAPLVKFLSNVSAKTPAGLRRQLLDDPDKFAEFSKHLKNLNEALGTSSTEPNVLMIDSPVGGMGAELSVFKSTATFYALDVTIE